MGNQLSLCRFARLGWVALFFLLTLPRLAAAVEVSRVAPTAAQPFFVAGSSLASGLLGLFFVLVALTVWALNLARQRRIALQNLTATLEARVAERTAELQANQERSAALDAFSPVGIFFTEGEKGCVYVNERWCELAGQTAEMARGDGWLEAVHPEDRESMQAAWSESQKTGSVYHFECRFQKNEDGVVWVLGQAVPWCQDGAVQGYMGCLTDITERKQVELYLIEAHSELECRVEERTTALESLNEEMKSEIAERKRVEERLRENRSVLRSFFDSAPMMMGITELLEDDIRHVSDNASAAAFYGKASPEMRGQLASALGESAETIAFWTELYHETVRTRRPVEFEYTLETNSGPCCLSGAICYVTTTSEGNPRFSYMMSDTTERKHAEEMQQRLVSILEATTDFVSITDVTGRIIYVNRAGREMLGIEKEENLTATKITQFQPPWAVEIFRHEAIPVAMLEDGWQGESALQHADGHEIPVSQVLLAHKSESGSVTFLSTIMRDISERQEAEKKIRISLEEKEVLLKEIHHRVKNNMQIVSSLLQLQSAYIKDPQAKEMFAESCDRIKSMALIHEKLYQSADLAEIDFGEYVSNLVGMIFSSYRRPGGSVDSRVQVEPVSLGIDTAIPIGLIVNELVTNSLKYAFAGRERGLLEVEIRALENERFVLIVRDDGVGLPADFNFGKANSLGLRLVRILATQIRGELTYRNGTGSEFSITFSDVPHEK